jgi:RHH-type rel operon transcriptional repressor/antitoxin RelB
MARHRRLDQPASPIAARRMRLVHALRTRYTCRASELEARMLAVRLPPEIEERLAALARRTGRSKSFYARQAILEHLDDLEDYYLAAQRLEERLPTVPLEEAERRLGLAD